MSEQEQPKDNVVELDSYRRKSETVEGNEEGVWEATSLPLLPGDATPVSPRIVKVSSGFGRLSVRAGDHTVRSMAA